MDIIIVSLIWLILLLCHKYYKDSIINRQRQKIRMLEEVWIRKKTRATIGIAALGGIIALGYAYTKHNTINKIFNRFDNRVGEKKYNILRWKDKATFEALDSNRHPRVIHNT